MGYTKCRYVPKKFASVFEYHTRRMFLSWQKTSLCQLNSIIALKDYSISPKNSSKSSLNPEITFDSTTWPAVNKMEGTYLPLVRV